MEPDNSPRKIQFTVPLLEPHLDPEAAEQSLREPFRRRVRALPQTGLTRRQQKSVPRVDKAIRRRRPTPATLVLTSDQSSPGSDSCEGERPPPSAGIRSPGEGDGLKQLREKMGFWSPESPPRSGDRTRSWRMSEELEIDEDRIPNPLLKSTLSMSPRQRKKMTRTTPTMKELQTMVEHHLGQQKQGEEPEEAAESTGTQESCPLEIPDTGSASRPGTPGIAPKPAASTPKIQEPCGVQPSTKDPLPPADSQGASLV